MDPGRIYLYIRPLRNTLGVDKIISTRVLKRKIKRVRELEDCGLVLREDRKIQVPFDFIHAYFNLRAVA